MIPVGRQRRSLNWGGRGPYEVCVHGVGGVNFYPQNDSLIAKKELAFARGQRPRI